MNRIFAALLLATLRLGPRYRPPGRNRPRPHRGGPVAGTFTAQQRLEIIDIIRGALKADPTILRDAVAALQQEEGQKQAAASQAALSEMEGALLRTPGDPVAGNPDGDVTLVEFYDVRCPFCRRMLPVMAELLKIGSQAARRVEGHSHPGARQRDRRPRGAGGPAPGRLPQAA